MGSGGYGKQGGCLHEFLSRKGVGDNTDVGAELKI